MHAAIARAERSRDLWATVNICDTAKHPDAIGIRASMPGTPKHARLAMRFRVQYRTDSGAWVQAGGFVTAGHSYTLELASRDDGYTGDPTYTLYDDVTLQ